MNENEKVEYILVDEVNGMAFGPFASEDEAMHVVETGEGAGDVPWGEYGWSIMPLCRPEPTR